jgi:hypothetical protein
VWRDYGKPGHRDGAPAGGAGRSRASPNSAPMRHISAPVAATRSTGSSASWIAG